MSFLVRFSIAFTLAVGAMVTLWIWNSDFSFNFTGLGSFFTGVLTLLAMSLLINAYSTIPWITRITSVLIWLSIFMSFTVVGAPSSYLFASVGGEFKDAWFVAADQAIGFEWMAVLKFFGDHAWLGEYTSSIYSSSAKTLIFVLMFLSFSGRHERGDLLLASAIVTGFLTALLAAPFAALGPFSYYNVPPGLYEGIAPAVTGVKGGEWLTHLMQLREGTFLELGRGVYQGIVQFPSFHTALSVLMIMALRGSGPAFWVGGFYNLLILLTVPIDGAHYFVDMIAGALVALVVWYGLAALNQMATHGVKYKRSFSIQWRPNGLLASMGARIIPLVNSLIITKSR